MSKDVRKYSTLEETIHSLTHGAGALLGVVGLILLIMKTREQGTVNLVGSILFGASLILLYSASCIYHGTCAYLGADSDNIVKVMTEKLDHCAIFILITGTYIPACWTALGGWVGWTVFGVVATCGIVGITLNCISVERFSKISLALYVIAGWMIALASVPYAKAIGLEGFAYLLAGGVSYTVGIAFYKAKSIPYMHVMWHVFVLLGSIMHYIMIYSYCY
ncbi:MAG: hemolysin III family protein [Clostridia bacterium]|nr:hemolysin III family protein [Clostridia bacterium]